MKTSHHSAFGSPFYWLLWLLVTGLSTWLLTTKYSYLALLPPVGVLILFFLGLRPIVGYLAIVFLVPYGAYTAFSDTYKYLTLSKFIGIFIIGFVLLSFVAKKGTESEMLKSNLWILLVSFFMSQVLATLLAAYPEGSYNFVRRLVTDYSIFLLTLFFVSPRVLKVHFPIILLASTGISALLSIFGYIFDISAFAMSIGSESVKRGVGTSHDPNYFSTMLIFSIPFACHFIFFARKKILRNLSFGVLLINVTGVILTYSRGGGLVLAIILTSLFFYHLQRLKPRHFGFLISMFVVGSIIVLSLVPQSYWERQKSITHVNEDRSIGRRVSYLYVGWDAFQTRPVFGSGPGSFKYIYEPTAYARKFQKEGLTNRRSAHNAYLEILVGSGILGLFTFLALISLSLINYQKAIRIFKAHARTRLASLTSAYYFGYLALLLSFLMLSANHLKYFWISLALSAVCLHLARQDIKEKGIE